MCKPCDGLSELKKVIISIVNQRDSIVSGAIAQILTGTSLKLIKSWRLSVQRLYLNLLIRRNTHFSLVRIILLHNQDVLYRA
jgi:hypothetical protein